jgi:hypothetical protein
MLLLSVWAHLASALAPLQHLQVRLLAHLKVFLHIIRSNKPGLFLTLLFPSLLTCLLKLYVYGIQQHDSVQHSTVHAAQQVLSTASAPPAIPSDFAQERVALEALYNATGGAHWSDSATNGWLGPCHCTWTDVTCANAKACDDSPVYAVIRQAPIENGHGKNLTGVLPSWNGDPGQGALPHLQHLGFTENPGLTGTLPEAWGDMVEMHTLALYSNLLDGPLPEAWGNMTKMAVLQLYSNSLDGTLPQSWGNMKEMTTLSSHNNDIDGTLPEAWGNMKEMKQLWISNNHLNGSLPAAWVNMAKMQSLQLSTNLLTGTLPDAWGNMTEMKQLYLYTNSLGGLLPEAWGNMAKMSDLELSTNRLDGTLPVEWENMKEMNALTLNNNHLNGSLPGAWGNMAKMQQLTLNNNHLDGSLPEAWGNMTKMKFLYL